jgi:hypothetical protein
VGVYELYVALRQAGVDEGAAQEAAKAVAGVCVGDAELATQGHVRLQLAHLRVELMRWITLAVIVALTGVVLAVVS